MPCKITAQRHVVLTIRSIVARTGGAECIYCELANLLVDCGYRVTCIYFDKADGQPSFPLKFRVARINLHNKKKMLCQKFWKNLAVFPLLPSILRNWADWKAKNGFFKSQLEVYFQTVRPDCVISFMPPANTVSLLAARESGIKVICTNHNVPEQDYASDKRWDQNPVDRRLRLSALNYASAIHVLFPEFAEWFPSNLQDQMVSIPNYIPCEFRNHRINEDREKLIIGVGRLTWVKNYSALVRAWGKIYRQYPNWRVVIYGDGPDRKALQREIDRAGVSDVFTLWGSKPHLADEYARASIFCHPARFEGFGLAAVEALSMGVPLVAYADCDGLNQFVKHQRNGFLAERDETGHSLASALSHLIEDEELRTSMGKSGPSSVAHFSLENYRKQWVQLIEKL
jgi:glycosyltransferase involved in cell wall biosynthesis